MMRCQLRSRYHERLGHCIEAHMSDGPIYSAWGKTHEEAGQKLLDGLQAQYGHHFKFEIAGTTLYSRPS